MARQVTNNSDWNYHQQQYPGRPGVPQQYGQNFAAPTQHLNASSKPSTDPWNWGWEESNGGSESSNNNSQLDPSWDWSVDSAAPAGFQEQLASIPTYSQANSTPQLWSGGYQQQFPPNYPPQVTNSHDVINDSYNPSAAVNQLSYGHMQPVFQPVSNSTPQQLSNSVEPQDMFFNNNLHARDQHQYPPVIASQSQVYFTGFHPPQTLGNQQQQNEGLGLLGDDSRIEEPKSSVSFSSGAPKKVTAGGNVDSSRDFHSRNVSHSAVTSDISHRSNSGMEVLSPQWSTESLPSQGSDEISQTTDNSNRQSETSTQSGDSSSPLNCTPSRTSLEGFETVCRNEQENLQSSLNRETNLAVNKGHNGQSQHTVNEHIANISDKISDASVPFFDKTMQGFSNHSPGLPSAISQGPPLVNSEKQVPLASKLFPSVESVSSDLQSLSLNPSTGDVENIEVAPPENSKTSTPSIVGASLPPPPVSSSALGSGRSSDKISNPYAAKGSSLNHKYANKNISRSRNLVPASQLPNDLDSESKPRSLAPATKTSNIPGEIEISQTGSTKSQATPSTLGIGFSNSPPQSRLPLPHPTEEPVNLETVPDNKERPDIDVQQERKSASPASGLRYHQTPVGQDAPASHSPLWPQGSVLPDNQEVYLDTPPGHSQEPSSHGVWHRPSNSEDVLRNVVHSELDRIVPGQGEEIPQLSSGVMQQNFAAHASDVNVEDIAKREIPGHQVAPPSMMLPQVSSGSAIEDISVRAVPGGRTTGNDSLPPSTIATSSSTYLHRTVPGGHQPSSHQPSTTPTDAPVIQGEDDTPPPGLSRMVPGESRGPEGQGGNGASVENALDEPRVVTGLAEDSHTLGNNGMNSSFRPVPDEPRVVTGVAQDELDNSLGQLTSPVSSSSIPSTSFDGRETADLDADGQESPEERTQLPSERSETIGSDYVETFPLPPMSDAVSRRDGDNPRRPAEDGDNSSVDLGRHGNSREYFGSINSRERDGDHSSENRRYRDDRDGRHYDREDHLYEHDREKSPRGRYPYNRDRGRFDEQDHGPHRRYDDQPRSNRWYKHGDDDVDEKDTYASEGEQKHKHDRDRVSSDKNRFRDQEEYNRYYNRRPRDPSDSHSRDFRERDRNRERDRDHERERDRDRDRDRDRERDKDRERDRDRDKDRDRDRDRYHDKRYPYERDYRRHEEYYAHYDDYYGNRSRPSSRSGSRPEFEDERRRDYHHYGGYYYQNPRAMYDDYNYRYLVAWQRYIQQHQQYQHHHQQQQQQQPQMPPRGTGMPEDRGSVHSGRSSTHDEINRHNLDRSAEHNVSVMEETTSSATPQRLTPAKFSTAHVKGLLSGSGHVIKILPHYPLDGQPATVEIHDISRIIVPDEELSAFPGPLIKGVTHKKSLINFCSHKIKAAEQNPSLLEKDSVILLWRLLLLLLRQNGMVIGTDIAELLLSNSTSEASSTGSINVLSSAVHPPNIRSVSPAGSANEIESENVASVKHAPTKNLNEEELANTFREYLLYGNTHEALEWAMKYGLWGHALFLASKLGNRTYANVMTRFANGLTLNDPLQTLYQLMSGRLPAAVTCCADEKWGDWKPHLAMILSNSSVQPELEHKAIVILGDTLASRGCLYAAHFCYLMAQLELGFYNKKSSKFVLIGSSHYKPFKLFASNEAIQMTEIYIYACQLADPDVDFPQFQMYKLLYAKRLVEAGMPKEALQYIEVIARSIFARPAAYNLDFIQQVFDLGDRLKIHDVSFSPDPADETEELLWLLQLNQILEDYMNGVIQPDGPSFGSTSNLSVSEGEPSHSLLLGSNLQQENNQKNEQPQVLLDQYSQNQFVEQQQQFSQPFSQEQQQMVLPSHANAQEGQGGYGSNIQMSTTSSEVVPDGVHMPTEWNTQVYQQELTSDNFVNKSHQDAANYWTQSQWDNRMVGDNANVPAALQDQQKTQVGWEFQPGVNRRDSGDAQDQASYYSRQSSAEHHQERSGDQLAHQTVLQPAPKIMGSTVPKPKPKKESSKKPQSVPARSSWFGGLWNKLSLRPKNQMILPDDKEPKIVWNSEKQRWVNTDAEDDEDGGDLPPPPKMADLPTPTPQIPSSTTSNGNIKIPPQTGQNMYKMNRGRGSRANYVDVFGGMKTSNQSVAAPEIFPTIAPPQKSQPGNFFIPAPVQTDDNTPVDFLSSGVEGAVGESTEASQVGAPLMFNPAEINQYAAHHTSTFSRKRYPN